MSYNDTSKILYPFTNEAIRTTAENIHNVSIFIYDNPAGSTITPTRAYLYQVIRGGAVVTLYFKVVSGITEHTVYVSINIGETYGYFDTGWCEIKATINSEAITAAGPFTAEEGVLEPCCIVWGVTRLPSVDDTIAADYPQGGWSISVTDELITINGDMPEEDAVVDVDGITNINGISRSVIKVRTSSSLQATFSGDTITISYMG